MACLCSILNGLCTYCRGELRFRSRNYQFEPLSLEILKVASQIDDMPELHDRLIAATAKYLDLPIITNDPAIRSSKFVTALA